jgi:hypothetical protein
MSCFLQICTYIFLGLCVFALRVTEDLAMAMVPFEDEGGAPIDKTANDHRRHVLFPLFSAGAWAVLLLVALGVLQWP